MPSGQEPKKKKTGKRPAHQNAYAFKHNKASKKTQKILKAPNMGLCEKCHQIIEWRKQYRKYKPLTQPRRCNLCQEKKITLAYHVVCDPCAANRKICAKCMQNDEDGLVGKELQAKAKGGEVDQLAEELARLPLRKQKKVLRDIDRQEYEERKEKRRALGIPSDSEDDEEDDDSDSDTEVQATKHVVDDDDDDSDSGNETDESDEQPQPSIIKKQIPNHVPSLSDDEEEDF